VPTFNVIWSDLTARLRSAMVSEASFDIPNWSNDKGFTGNISRVEAVNYDEVVFIGERTTEPRRVSRRDFKKIFEDYWERYKQGTVSREELVRASRNSTYIISVLHWLEN
jgi:hypothetical protein